MIHRSGLSSEIIQESPANTERYLDSDIDDDGGIITYEKAVMEKQDVDVSVLKNGK